MSLSSASSLTGVVCWQLTSHSSNMRVRKAYSLARRDRKSIISSTHSGSFSGSRLQREASTTRGTKISVTKAEASAPTSQSNKTFPLALRVMM